MKVYFGTSPRTKERYSDDVLKIYSLIEKLGYKHTSDFVAKVNPEEFYKLPQDHYSQNYKDTLQSIKEADICVFEASLHSLSVGYLVNYSLDLGKPVVVLSQTENPEFLFVGIKTEGLFFVRYNKDDCAIKLEDVLEEAKGKMDIRFNFFITPRLLAYLDWLSGKKRVPRSVYLRNLIEREMSLDKEYQEEISSNSI